MGLQALRRKRYGVALSWCLRAKDEVFSSYLTDQFLNHYMETGTFLQCDLIDNLGSSMLLSNKLTFFKGYFYHMKNDRDFSGSTIVTIIKPHQLCAYKAPVESWKFKLHFCLKLSW